MPSPPAVALTALSQDTLFNKGSVIDQIAKITLTSVKQNGVATMSTMEVSSLICRDFINTFDATFLGEVTAPNITGGNVAGSRISSFDTVNGRSMNATTMSAGNVNVSSVNGQLYPPPAAVSSINGQLSSLTVSSFVSANSYQVGAGQSIAWPVGGQIVQYDEAGGTFSLNMQANGGINFASAGGVRADSYLYAPLISSLSTTSATGYISSLSATSGNISSLFAFNGVVGNDLDVEGDLQCLGNIACDNDISAQNFGGDTVTVLVAEIGSVNASTITAPQLTGVSSINGTNNFLYNPAPAFSTVTATALNSLSSVTSPVAVIGRVPSSITFNGPVIASSTLTATALNSVSSMTSPVAVIGNVPSSITFNGPVTVSSTLTAPSVAVSSIGANTMSVSSLSARSLQGVSTLNVTDIFVSDSIAVAGGGIETTQLYATDNCLFSGNSVDITCPLRVFNSAIVMPGNTLTTSSLNMTSGEILNVSSFNGSPANRPLFSTIVVQGPATLGEIEGGIINAQSVNTINSLITTLRAGSISTGNLKASTIFAPASVSTVALSASSINGALLSPVLLGFSTASMALNNDSDLIVNAAVGDATLASQNGIVNLDGATGVQIQCAAVPAGSATFIDGINWSTLVGIVKGLSSFS